MNKTYRPSSPDRVFFGWCLYNIPFLSLLAAGLVTGFLTPYIADVTHLTHIIIGITVLFTLNAGHVAWDIARDFKNVEDIRSQYHGLHVNQDAIYQRIDGRLDTTRYVSTLLVGLGFLGTVIGVIIGLQNFPANAFTDVAAMQVFIQNMLVGFSTELHTLVAGLVGSIWLSFNVHILERSDSKLYMEIIR